MIFIVMLTETCTSHCCCLVCCCDMNKRKTIVLSAGGCFKSQSCSRLKSFLMSRVNLWQGFCFGKSGEVLTLKIRLKAFTAMMRQVSRSRSLERVILGTLFCCLDEYKNDSVYSYRPGTKLRKTTNQNVNQQQWPVFAGSRLVWQSQKQRGSAHDTAGYRRSPSPGGESTESLECRHMRPMILLTHLSPLSLSTRLRRLQGCAWPRSYKTFPTWVSVSLYPSFLAGSSPCSSWLWCPSSRLPPLQRWSCWPDTLLRIRESWRRRERWRSTRFFPKQNIVFD